MKYFLNLEKRHFKLNVISQLKINENEFVTSDTDILAECETFYKILYAILKVTQCCQKTNSFNLRMTLY